MRTDVMNKLFAVGAALGPAVTAQLAAEGLTPARVGLVNRIRQHGPMSQRALSDELGCTPRNITGLVDAVEALGLVQRKADPRDRRAVLVALTAAGEHAAAAWEQRAVDMAARLLAEVPDDDVERLMMTLDIVLSRLREEYADR
jgi:DNA-binding MarR family transcriptional regulator